MSVSDKTSPSRRNGTIEHFKTSRWNEMNKRVKNGASYIKKNISVTMSKQDFYKWCDNQIPFIYYMFSKGVKPTIDRINGDGNYSLDNIQILSWSDNAKKQRRKPSKPIIASCQGVSVEFHGVYSSECIDFFGYNRCSDILKVLRGTQNSNGSVHKTVKGWSFRYATQGK